MGSEHMRCNAKRASETSTRHCPKEYAFDNVWQPNSCKACGKFFMLSRAGLRRCSEVQSRRFYSLAHEVEKLQLQVAAARFSKKFSLSQTISIQML